jgi:hypothetical protein
MSGAVVFETTPLHGAGSTPALPPGGGAFYQTPFPAMATPALPGGVGGFQSFDAGTGVDMGNGVHRRTLSTATMTRTWQTHAQGVVDRLADQGELVYYSHVDRSLDYSHNEDSPMVPLSDIIRACADPNAPAHPYVPVRFVHGPLDDEAVEQLLEPWRRLLGPGHDGVIATVRDEITNGRSYTYQQVRVFGPGERGALPHLLRQTGGLVDMYDPEQRIETRWRTVVAPPGGDDTVVNEALARLSDQLPRCGVARTHAGSLIGGYQRDEATKRLHTIEQASVGYGGATVQDITHQGHVDIRNYWHGCAPVHAGTTLHLVMHLTLPNGVLPTLNDTLLRSWETMQSRAGQSENVLRTYVRSLMGTSLPHIRITPFASAEYMGDPTAWPGFNRYFRPFGWRCTVDCVGQASAAIIPTNNRADYTGLQPPVNLRNGRLSARNDAGEFLGTDGYEDISVWYNRQPSWNGFTSRWLLVG